MEATPGNASAASKCCHAISPGSDLDIAWRDAAEKLESRSLAADARRAALAPAIAHLESEAALYGLELSEALAL